MKKHLSLLVRIMVAIAGLGYIAWVIDWTDRVEVPAGVAITDTGHKVELSKARKFPVVSGDFDPRKLDRAVQVDLASTGQVDAGKGVLTIAPDTLQQSNSGYILRPGIITTLKHANLNLLLLGWIIIAPIYPITVFRWWMLLKARGLDVPIGKTFRLCMVGCFFNYCMPGSTGGDVLKAYYAAKHSDRRADAVMTVIIDRIVGLLGLFILAGVAGAFLTGGGRAHKVTWFVWGVSALVVFVSAFYFSRRLRKASGLDWLLTKVLPRESILAKIDQAAAAYSHHKTVVLSSILLSLPVHLLLAISAAFAGFALGMQRSGESFTLLLTVVPVLFLIAAVPISIQGVGTMEAIAFALLLSRPGYVSPLAATPNQIVVMLVVIRLYQLLYSLTGSIFLLQGDIHMYPEQHEGKPAGDKQPVTTPAV